MITYELLLVLRVMQRNELKTVLRRVANSVFDKGGIIRRLENLGTRELPYKISAHGSPHRQASYFLYDINIPPSEIEVFKDECQRDVDILRKRLFKKTVQEPFDCTLHEEMLPAPYRKDVQDLIKQARKLDKPGYQYNSELEYYPFQK